MSDTRPLPRRTGPGFRLPWLTPQESRRVLVLLALAVTVPPVLVFVDALVVAWLPWAFYIAIALLILVGLPWALGSIGGEQGEQT